MYKILKILCGLCLFSSFIVFPQNTKSDVNNVTFEQREDGSFVVDVYYDLVGEENRLYRITMQVSENNGFSWDFSCKRAEGDIGPDITVGDKKHIVWDFGAEHPNTYGEFFRVKIIAENMVLIQNQPCPDLPTIYYEGVLYNTVQIAGQCWLKENLNLGKLIPSYDNMDNQKNNGVVEKYCYDNSEENCQRYGGLYQWNEAMQYTADEGARGICPPGWHIPSYVEFLLLRDTIGRSSNALKAIGEGIGNGIGTNTTGFTALLAGFRYSINGMFYDETRNTFFWTSTKRENDTAIFIYLYDSNDNIYALDYHHNYGCSVRCLKDD